MSTDHQQSRTVDLRNETPSHVRTAAFAEIRELVRGTSIILLTQEEPTMTLQAVNLQLRDNLSWTTSQEPEGYWRTEIKHREDTAPVDMIDVLTRDHKRLDDLFARALHLVNAGNVADAAPLLKEFAEGMRRHVDVENNLLAAAFAAPRDPYGADPTSTMLREHDEIMSQVEVLESFFADETPDPAEVSAFFAIISGILAKHEYREENNLFPNWRSAVHRVSPEIAIQLMHRVEDRLHGATEDGTGR